MQKHQTISDTATPLKPTEVWQQDALDADFWHGPNGIIVNTAALKEREFYFDIVCAEAHKLAS